MSNGRRYSSHTAQPNGVNRSKRKMPKLKTRMPPALYGNVFRSLFPTWTTRGPCPRYRRVFYRVFFDQSRAHGPPDTCFRPSSQEYAGFTPFPLPRGARYVQPLHRSGDDLHAHPESQVEDPRDLFERPERA